MNYSNWRSRLQNSAYVTNAILAVTILVFLLETFSGGSTNNSVLVFYGARLNPLILYGQWWRLMTPVFVHIGLMHILVNGFSLYYLGQMTEQLFGHWRFFLLYFISGFAGNVASFAFSPNTLAAGASTAIFGLLGACLMLGDSFKENPVIRQLARQFLLLVGLNLLFNLISSGIDIFGHIGGLLGGFLAAGMLGAPALGRMGTPRRIASAVTLPFGLGALLFLGFNAG